MHFHVRRVNLDVAVFVMEVFPGPSQNGPRIHFSHLFNGADYRIAWLMMRVKQPFVKKMLNNFKVLPAYFSGRVNYSLPYLPIAVL